MKGVTFIFALVFSFFLVTNVSAQVQIDPTNGNCPDKCENSILYLKGIFNEKTKTCSYGYHEDCEYDCRTDKPACNELPRNDTPTSLEKIYEEIRRVEERTHLPSISVHGTEYQAGDSGTVFLQLVYDYEPINNGSCELTAYYPNKSVFINGTSMIYLAGSDGIYYVDFTIPNTNGVYIVSAICNYPFNVTIEKASDFTLIYGNDYEGSYSRTWYIDDLVHDIREDRDSIGQPFYFNFTYNFSFPAVNKSGIYRIDFEITNDWYKVNSPNIPEDENVYMKLWNFNTSSWEILNNEIPPSPKNSFALTTNTKNIDGTGFSNYFNNDSNLWLGFSDTNQTETDDKGALRTNYLHVKIYELDETPYEVRGSGEIHVSDLTENVWTYPNRTLTAGNVTWNATLNVSVSVNVSEIWNYENRTLTDYNQSDIFLYLQEINDTIYIGFENLTQLINNVNNTLYNKIHGVNHSIWSKLYNIQDELLDINNNLTLIYSLIGDVNQTIMTKLHSIQDEIASLNESILNLENVSLNITIEQEELLDTMIALLGDNNLKESYTSFSGIGMFPLGGFGGEEIQYYCKDNSTLVSVEYINYTGDINKTYAKTKERPCTYGCMENACVLPPYAIWSIAGLIILALFFIAEYLHLKNYF